MKNSSTRMQLFKLAGTLVSSFVLLALIIAGATLTFHKAYGWFAMNRSVEGTDMEVGLSSDLLELAVSGDQVSNYADNSPIVEYLSDPLNGGFQKLSITDHQNPSIICRMWDETPVQPEAGKVSPGSYGYISFDLVIKSYVASVEFDLDFLALAADGSGNIGPLDAADADTVNELLTGHILFFTDRTTGDGGYYYSGELATDNYVYTLADHTADKVVAADGDHYTITLYWVWPVNYAQMAYQKGHPYLKSHALFAADSESEAERSAMVADMAAHPARYFYEYNTETVTVDFTDPDFKTLYYVNLTDGYNNADQYIGEKVNYLVVCVTADAYGD